MNCQHCGKDISPRATACPHCGEPRPLSGLDKMEKFGKDLNRTGNDILKAVILLPVLIVILVLCMGMCKS